VPLTDTDIASQFDIDLEVEGIPVRVKHFNSRDRVFLRVVGIARLSLWRPRFALHPFLWPLNDGPYANQGAPEHVTPSARGFAGEVCAYAAFYSQLLLKGSLLKRFSRKPHATIAPLSSYILVAAAIETPSF
jgi:hypothetical protein